MWKYRSIHTHNKISQTDALTRFSVKLLQLLSNTEQQQQQDVLVIFMALKMGWCQSGQWPDISSHGLLLERSG